MFVRPYTCAYVSIYVCVCHTVTSGYLCLKAVRKVVREREREGKEINCYFGVSALSAVFWPGEEEKEGGETRRGKRRRKKVRRERARAIGYQDGGERKIEMVAH